MERRSSLRIEYENKVIELAKEYIQKMQPLVEIERANDPDWASDLELDQSGIASVIDEYFDRGFTIEKALKEISSDQQELL